LKDNKDVQLIHMLIMKPLRAISATVD